MPLKAFETLRAGENMFKIGDFSKLSQVTVKALRFYDENGLLKPAHVDELTGYRYYSADQLRQLNRILALKDLGLTLEQIGSLLASGLTPVRLREMLHTKQAEIESRMRDEQALLARVEARLRQIEQEDSTLEANVVIKKIDPIRVVSIRETVPTYPDIGRLFGELFGSLGRRGIRPLGPALALWHDPEYKERDVDAEAAVPVAPSADGNGRIQVKDLDAVESMACIVHKGSYATLSQSYGALMKWIETNGYRIDGPVREVYLYCGQGPVRQDDESYVTEIQAPVEKV